MGTIAAGSALEAFVTQKPDFTSPNASKPSCVTLPTTDASPSALSVPTGGLMGSISVINVNEGTDFGIDAVALAQWSDKVQWSPPGTTTPSIADASPPFSAVFDSREDADFVVVTQWSTRRDAVSALFMTYGITNDFSVEPAIKAATDWIVTMPTKRFYVRGPKRPRRSATFPHPVNWRAPAICRGTLRRGYMSTENRWLGIRTIVRRYSASADWNTCGMR